MSFNGITKILPPTFEPMKPTSIITDGCDCYPWHQVFAWLPVKTISGKRIWWNKVYKRKVWIVWGTGFHMEPEVQYADVFDMITNTDDIL